MKFAGSTWLIALTAWMVAAAPFSLGAGVPDVFLIAEYSKAAESERDAERMFAILGKNEIGAVAVSGPPDGLGRQIGVWNHDVLKAKKLIEEAIQSEGLRIKLLPREAAHVLRSSTLLFSNPKRASRGAQEAANAYLSSLPDPPKDEKLRSARHFYWGLFFRGFLSINRTTSQRGLMTSLGSNMGNHAREAGKAYRQSHPEDFGKVMAGFGYTPLEVDGSWLVKGERSEFRPHERAIEGRWWLWMLENVDSDLPTAENLPEGLMPIQITGYLSLPGSYEYKGSCDHEFYVTKVRRLPDAR